MSVEKELEESLKKINETQAEVASKVESLEEQVELLNKRVDQLAEDMQKDPKESLQLELLTELCLLSELSAAVDFDQMIDAREKFKNLLPNHFEQYLKYLEMLPQEVVWSGCLNCRHFLGRCKLNLRPVESSSDEHGLEKTCPSHVRRSRKL